MTTDVLKTCSLKIRISDSDLADIDQLAKKTGEKRSAFCREILRQATGKTVFLSQEDKAIFALLHEDMRKIGINVNQIARRLNAGKTVHPTEVIIALKNVLTVFDNLSLELVELKSRRSAMAVKDE